MQASACHFNLDVDEIQWSHSTIFDHFSHHHDRPGRSIFETVVQLLLGESTIESIPAIRVAQKGSSFFSLSNRRLFVFRTYQQILKRFDANAPALIVPVILAGTYHENMFTTDNGGTSVTLVRPSHINFQAWCRGQESKKTPLGDVLASEEECFPESVDTPTELPQSLSLQSSSSASYSPFLPFTLVALPELDSNMIVCVHCEDKSSELFRRASELCHLSIGSNDFREDHIVWESSIGCTLRAQLGERGAPWDRRDNWFWFGTAEGTTYGKMIAIGAGTARVKCERAVRLALAATALSRSSNLNASMMGQEEDPELVSFFGAVRHSLAATRVGQQPLPPPPPARGPQSKASHCNQESRTYSRNKLIATHYRSKEQYVGYSLGTKTVAIAHSQYCAEGGGYMSLSIGDRVVLLSNNAQVGAEADRYATYVFGVRERPLDEDVFDGAYLGWFPEDVVHLRPSPL